MTEPRGIALKRLRMRSWRRGTKEMDLILGGFADRMLESLDADQLKTYEELLEENDQDLYSWAAGVDDPPEKYKELLAQIMSVTSC